MSIGVFKTDKPIVLIRAGNGGWVVSQTEEPGLMAQNLGAYSNAKDMLDALSEALLANPHKERIEA